MNYSLLFQCWEHGRSRVEQKAAGGKEAEGAAEIRQLVQGREVKGRPEEPSETGKETFSLLEHEDVQVIKAAIVWSGGAELGS